MALTRVWGVPRLPAHRIAYRKRIIEKAGCFDENLGVAEDMDFFKRVSNLKAKVGYAEPVQVETSIFMRARAPFHLQLFKETYRIKAFKRIGNKHLEHRQNV